ncbi:hypothetical protein [Oleiharenicola lentus]|uniref:hypothetical protein n=1 Tax=Oleiharenicola lentus TaxID=2508720 RepID=UPI003F66E641
MSLNRYEQTLFDYVNGHPDERRHWHAKVNEVARCFGALGENARMLERDLWDYFVERSAHVPRLRELNFGAGQRVSLLNLAEYLLRVWGPPPKPKKPALPFE